ncbi:MAG TPA: hypothetical protein VHH34_00415 [Pseudonocardiaceae bacterium]|nr:hypothetical protein [Pseudonocardiaceae bacterium]
MAEPTRPGGIPHSMLLGDLAEHAQRHAAALFDHRLGITSLGDTERGGHALAELAYTAALSERALHGRWVVVCEALDAGKNHEQVAAAMNLDVDELRAGLRSWARNQLRQGLIDADRHAEVLALLGEPEVQRPPAGES